MKPHVLDKPILRDIFWFIVLPYQLRQWLDGAARAKGGS